MATKVSIQISSQDTSGKKQTDKISYVNPEATDAHLKEFAQKLIALTSDTYIGTTKITEESID